MEAATSPDRDGLIERLTEELLRRASASPHPLRVGIDGRSNAGKTTLANELAESLDARAAPNVRASIDEFHRPGHKFRSIRREWTPESRLAEGLDYGAFLTCVLEPLGPGGTLRCRRRYFDSYNDRPFPEQWDDIAPASILVCDAGHGFMPALVGHWDYRIWLEVTDETQMSRALERDAWLAGSRDEVRLRFEQLWLPTDALYRARYHPVGRSHCVIDNNDLARPRFLRI